MFSKEQLQKLYWEEGKSLAQIGELYQRDPTAIKRWMILFGIPRRPVGKPNSGRYFRCEVCKNEFYVTSSRASHFPPRYCSMKCRTIGQKGRELKSTERLKNTSAITHRLRKELGKCQICGYDKEPRILTTHHKNMNHGENSPNNLLLLCPNCHSLEHLKLSSRPQPPIIFFDRKRRPYSEWTIKGEYTCQNCGKTFKSPTLRRKYCFDCIPINASTRDYKAMHEKWVTLKDKEVSK